LPDVASDERVCACFNAGRGDFGAIGGLEISGQAPGNARANVPFSRVEMTLIDAQLAQLSRKHLRLFQQARTKSK